MKCSGLIVSTVTLMFFPFAGPLYAKRPLWRCSDLTTDSLALKGVMIADREAVVDEYGPECICRK